MGRGDDIKELMQPKRSREYTLNVDEKTYELVSQVAKETGKSRPKVLAAFVAEAYAVYQKVKKEAKSDDVAGAGEGGR